MVHILGPAQTEKGAVFLKIADAVQSCLLLNCGLDVLATQLVI